MFVCVLHIIHGFGWVGVIVIHYWDGYTQYSYDIVYSHCGGPQPSIVSDTWYINMNMLSGDPPSKFRLLGPVEGIEGGGQTPGCHAGHLKGQLFSQWDVRTCGAMRFNIHRKRCRSFYGCAGGGQGQCQTQR